MIQFVWEGQAEWEAMSLFADEFLLLHYRRIQQKKEEERLYQTLLKGS